MEGRNISRAQLRAARSLVGLSKEALARKAGIASKTLHRMEEQDGSQISDDVIRAVVNVLEALGVEFLSNSGLSEPSVRLAKRHAFD